MRWHPSGEILVSASYDDAIKLWVEEDDEWVCAQTLAGKLVGVRCWVCPMSGLCTAATGLSSKEHPTGGHLAQLNLYLSVLAILHCRAGRGPCIHSVGGGV